MTPLESALALAAKGLPVFPVVRTGTGKKPGISRWQWLATADAAQVRRWWSRPRFADASVGIHPVGLLVVDVDGPAGEDNLRRLREDYPLPNTLTIRSGNTGEPHHYQLLYRLPDGLRAVPRPLDAVAGFGPFDKIDIKGSGGQIIGPGSVHRTGGVYRWDREPGDVHAEATPAPDWMLDALCGPEKYGPRVLADPGSDDELAQTLLARFPVEGPGRRHAQMCRAVLWLAGHGHAADTITRLMTRWLNFFRANFSPTTAPDEAFEELTRCVHATVHKIERGDLDRFEDHQQNAVDAPLPAAAVDWYSRLLGTTPPDTGKGGEHNHVVVLSPPRSRLSDTDARFVAALLRHVNYEQQKPGAGELIPLTDRQVLAVIAKTDGTRLGWKTFYAAKRKWVSGFNADGSPRPAGVRELLALVRPGHYGSASVYRLTGLAAAFPPVLATQEVPDAYATASQPGPAGPPGRAEPPVLRPVRGRGRPARPAGDGDGGGRSAGRADRHPVHEPAVPGERPGRAVPCLLPRAARRGRVPVPAPDAGSPAAQGADGVCGGAGLLPGGVGGGGGLGGGGCPGPQTDPDELERLMALLDDEAEPRS